MNLKINSLQHIGLTVSDIEISEVFYSKLGFENVMESTFEHNGEKGGRVKMMKLNEIIVEIYQFPASEIPAIKNRKDGHIDHIAFDVSDIDQTFNLLKINGYNILENEPVFLNFWEKGCKYFNILGPDGERLEFNQIL
ncbi:MAG: VOC family protein [Cytophagaceae bacterium]|nr:VOC family protein [Cytophagaceae bacterium]